MTQEERAEVWSRRDQLTAQLNTIDNTEANTVARKAITTQIEACHQELISNTYNPPKPVETNLEPVTG